MYPALNFVHYRYPASITDLNIIIKKPNESDHRRPYTTRKITTEKLGKNATRRPRSRTTKRYTSATGPFASLLRKYTELFANFSFAKMMPILHYDTHHARAQGDLLYWQLALILLSKECTCINAVQFYASARWPKALAPKERGAPDSSGTWQNSQACSSSVLIQLPQL